MTQELAPINNAPLAELLAASGTLQKYSDDDFSKVVTAGYFPRLQLMTAKSDECIAQRFPVNHYAFIRDQELIDLGETVDCLPIAWRPKALDVSDRSQVISVYDPDSDEFKRIYAESGVQDSGCMYGPEFLIWIPQIKQFGCLFMGSKSARRESGNIKTKLQSPITLKSKLIETAKYKWYSPVATICTTPFELPTPEILLDNVEKFNNPPESMVEKADTSQEERAR